MTSAPVPAAAGQLEEQQQQEQLTRLVLDALPSPHSRRAYGRALSEFFAWRQARGGGAFSKAMVTAYRAWLVQNELAPASVNLRLAAVRKLAAEAADNGLLAAEVAAAVGRVQGARRLGVRTGRWLDIGQTERLLALPDAGTVKGKRDRALLALLVGCGLRRSEAVALTVTHLQRRDGRWAIVDLVGKHGRIRSVPMPDWAKAAVDDWLAAAGGITDGPVLRAVNKSGRPAARGMTAQALYNAVAGYAAAGLTLDLGPHDLRRTFGKLAHQGGARIEQIQLSYGHASLTTTERYLGIRQDFADAPCDRLGIALRACAKT